MGQKKGRTNLAVSATPEVLAEIDALVEASPVDTTRSGVALACIRAGLPIVWAQMRAAASAHVPVPKAEGAGVVKKGRAK